MLSPRRGLDLLAFASRAALLIAAFLVSRAECGRSCYSVNSSCLFFWPGFAYDFFVGSNLHNAIIDIQAGTAACLTASNGPAFIPIKENGTSAPLPYPGITSSGGLQCPNTKDARCRVHRVAAPGLLAPYGLAALEACVAASLPGEVADLFLAGPCMAEAMARWASGGSGASRNQRAPLLLNVTGPDLQRAVWWSPACMNRSPQALKVFADAVAAALEASPAPTLNAMRDFLAAERLCTISGAPSNASACEARVPDNMALVSDGGTSCSTRTVWTLAGCCGNISEVNLANTDTRGRLPSGFTLARVRTNLSDNPYLCGTVRRMAPDARNARTPPLPVLYNSKVQLNLTTLSWQYPHFVPHVITWLGNMTLSRENLAPVELDTSIAVTACELLRVNRLTVKERRPCGAKPFSASWKRHEAECYETKLNLSISDPDEQRRALREYNAYVDTLSTGLMCGPTGRSYRKKVVGATIGAALGAAILWTLLQLNMDLILGIAGHSDSEIGGQPAWKAVPRLVWCYIVHFLEFCALGYDEASDWIFIYQVASYGNLRVTITLGWILVVKNFVAPLAQSALVHKASILNSRRPLRSMAAIPLLMIIPIGFCASATRQISKAHSDGDVFCSDDSTYLFWWFLGISIPGALACVVLALVMRSHLYFQLDEPETIRTAHVKYTVLISVWFWLLEDLPQAIAQAVLWVSGAALTTTTSYVMSGAPAWFNIFNFVCSFIRTLLVEAGSDSHEFSTSPQTGAATADKGPVYACTSGS